MQGEGHGSQPSDCSVHRPGAGSDLHAAVHDRDLEAFHMTFFIESPRNRGFWHVIETFYSLELLDIGYQ